MNYAWIAYEKGLHHLLQHLPQNHAEYSNVCTLQKRLLENIAHAKSQGDTDALHGERKRIIADLENSTKQVMEDGFMTLCRANCVLFRYIAHVYETASDASNVFGGDRIWPDQCQYLVEDFGKRPAVAEATKEIVGGTWALSSIDGRVINLVQFVEEYELSTRQVSRRAGNKQEVIRQLNLFLEEMQTIDNRAFKELIEWYQDVARSANFPQTSPVLPLIDVDTPPASAQAQPQDQQPAHPPEPQYEEEPPHSGTMGSGDSYDDYSPPPPKQEEEPPPEAFSQDEINQVTLREFMVQAFSLEELRTLCADLTQELRNQHIHELITLDMLPGNDLRGKVQSLIEYCDRRGYLPFLVATIQTARPLLKW